MQDTNRSAIAIGITCVLFGCGGGGGGSSLNPQIPAELVKITSENGGKVAQTSIDTGNNIVKSGSVPNLFTAKQEGARNNEQSVMERLLYILSDYRFSGFQTLAVSRATIETKSCSKGGTFSGDFSDNNANGVFDTSDSLSLTLQNCMEEDFILNGGLRVEINRLQANDFEMAVRANSLSITAEGELISLNGDFNMSSVYDAQSGVTTYTFHGSELNYRENDIEAQLTSFSFVEKLGGAVPEQYSVEYNYNYIGMDIGGQVRVMTEVPFAGQGDLAPDAGKATITGADSSAIVIEANSGQASIFLDVNASGEFDNLDELIYTGPWGQFFGE